MQKADDVEKMSKNIIKGFDIKNLIYIARIKQLLMK